MKKFFLVIFIVAISAGIIFIARRRSSVALSAEPDKPVPAMQNDMINGRHDHPLFSERPAVVDQRYTENDRDISDSGNTASTNQPDTADYGKDVIPDEYILSFYSEDDRDRFIELAESMGAEILGRMELGNSIRLRAGHDIMQRLQREAPSAVEFARNRQMNNPVLPIIDPQSPQGRYKAFGNRTLNWLGVGNNSKWGNGVKVAILDSGINIHSALAGAHITYLDLLGGDGHDPSGSSAHGTAVASLIAGNGEQLSGIAPAADIIGIRVIDEKGKGNIFTVAQGIVAAVDNGASVINLSMGTRTDSFILREAVDYARAHGAVIVASAGNDASYGVSYPAGYNDVVGVSAVDAEGRHLYFSNRGSTVDIAAPGLAVDAAGPGDSFVQFSGTSAAAPLVSGAIAAIMSRNPGISVADAVRILEFYSDDGGPPGADDELGSGVMDMRRVEERDEPGIYDIAVCNPYLEKSDGGDILLGAVVQNQGTEPIDTVKLEVNIEGAKYSVFFRNISVGESVSERFTVPSSGVQDDDSVDVEINAYIMDGSDEYPWNNQRQITVYWN